CAAGIAADCLMATARFHDQVSSSHPAIYAADTVAVLYLFHELRFQAHGTEAIYLAVDIMIAIDQTDILDLGTNLERAAATFQFEILDQGNGIAVLQDSTDRVAVDTHGISGFHRSLRRAFMRTLGADQQRTIFIGVFGLALRAGR